MLGRKRLAVHFISNQNVRPYAINGHILDIGFDADAGEIAIVRAGRPHKSNGRMRLALSENVGEARAGPGDVANALRRLRRRQRAAGALERVCGRTTSPSIANDQPSRAMRGNQR